MLFLRIYKYIKSNKHKIKIEKSIKIFNIP